MDLLRQYLWECELAQDNSFGDDVVFDDTSKSRIMEAIEAINQGEKVESVIFKFVYKNLRKRRYKITVRDNGKRDEVEVGIFRSLCEEPYQCIKRIKEDELQKIAAKRMILALARVREIVRFGKRTDYIPNDAAHLTASGKQKHKGAKFVYSMHDVREWAHETETLKNDKKPKKVGEKQEKEMFTAIAEILLPKIGEKQIYQMNIEGSTTFKDRSRAIACALRVKSGGSPVVEFYEGKAEE